MGQIVKPAGKKVFREYLLKADGCFTVFGPGIELTDLMFS